MFPQCTLFFQVSSTQPDLALGSLCGADFQSHQPPGIPLILLLKKNCESKTLVIMYLRHSVSALHPIINKVCLIRRYISTYSKVIKLKYFTLHIFPSFIKVFDGIGLEKTLAPNRKVESAQYICTNMLQKMKLQLFF